MLLIRFAILGGFLIPSVMLLAQKDSQTPGLRIILPNVQFAAEKSSIRSDAANELNEVASLLKKSPAVSVEIGAHTDASGSAGYNLRLSQQRAQAVSSYLINKGIAPKRVRFKGYGETQPLNRCRRGVRCSDAEKRQNRRIELRVFGLPADSTVRAQWLALKGPRFFGAPTAATQVVQKSPPAVPTLAHQAVAATPVSEPVAVADVKGDYFAELRVANPHVPQPLPNTFTGYTIEVSCTDKPLAPGHPVLQAYDPVFLRQEVGGRYCYFVSAFYTLPEARQFLIEKVLPRFSAAQVVAFSSNEKKYLSN